MSSRRTRRDRPHRSRVYNSERTKPIAVAKVIDTKPCTICTIPIHEFNTMCQACADLRRRTRANALTADEIRPGFRLKVKFHAMRRSHDGYCSDHDDPQVNETNHVEYHPILKLFQKADFDDEGHAHLANSKFTLYLPENECGGWCNDCRTIYTLISAKLVDTSIKDRIFN